LVVSWLLGSFQTSATQHLLFQTMGIVCFLWVKGLYQWCSPFVNNPEICFSSLFLFGV
jgi:hypothetical protein